VLAKSSIAVLKVSPSDVILKSDELAHCQVRALILPSAHTPGRAVDCDQTVTVFDSKIDSGFNTEGVDEVENVFHSLWPF
jgi:hypothetical protein